VQRATVKIRRDPGRTPIYGVAAGQVIARSIKYRPAKKTRANPGHAVPAPCFTLRAVSGLCEYWNFLYIMRLIRL